MTNYLFWRHAEAEMTSQSGLDADRTLTPLGEQQAQKMAHWLTRHMPSHCNILCSPARRCQQTAQALLQAMHSQNKGERFVPPAITYLDGLKVDASAGEVMQCVVNHDEKQNLLVIGHQPYLGEVLCELINLQPEHCVVKKGSVWWIKTRVVDGRSQRYLYALQQPILSSLK